MIDLQTLIAPLPETVILGNGAFPENPQVLNILRQSCTLVCCDGAVNKLRAAGLKPNVIVGDLDSIQQEYLHTSSAKVCPDKSEDYNDMQKALKYCMSQNIHEILLLGFSGLREDHFIANVSIMVNYSEQLNLQMITDHGVFNTLRQTTTLPSVAGQQVSIFSRDQHMPLTFHGLKYPVERRCFQHLWEGSLNEALGEEFTIELHKAGHIIVYRAL